MTNDPVESREKVKAAREAKKLAKQQAKLKKDTGIDLKQAQTSSKNVDSADNVPAKSDNSKEQIKVDNNKGSVKELKSKDEVDKVVILEDETVQGSEAGREQVKAEREAKKAAKQAKKTGTAGSDTPATPIVKADTEMTKTPKDQKKDPQPKVSDSKNLETTAKDSEDGKSKAQLRAERRAKQEAQRAAKEAAAQAKVAAKDSNTQPSKDDTKSATVKEKSPKLKTAIKAAPKQQAHRVNWFRHLYHDDKAKLDKLPINSNLHPAIIKLGVQLATRVVTGSNARCIALLDALKKMVRDYSLPARTEFARGLEAHLAASLRFLWALRPPAASQTNAVNFFRHRLAQLPNNVDEFDAKKSLQEEIDRYIREQIEMAGEAISLTVRSKICKDDLILTYGCSSLIERILVEAHESGTQFRVVVVGGGAAARGAREMTRRLAARRVPCICVDIVALGCVMLSVDKVVLGASALLANGWVLGAAGTGAVALAARGCNVPVLVACETHKFSERVHTDSLVCNEIGDPDDLIDKSDPNSPLRDWRACPSLTPLNLTYDVTPAHLVTAVVTELAILPCTSAPVVLRFKLSEYSV